MNGANMPQPSDPVKSNGPRRIIFVRQRFSRFGGGELILDRTLAALNARGLNIALLGRSWGSGGAFEFIRCDPPRFPRFRRERQFATAACRLLAQEKDCIVQSHERIPCCDIFRAGDGVHAAFLAHRARGMNALAARALYLHPFHRSVMALEREMFASPRLKAVIANSQMIADEIVQHFGFAREKIHLVPNGIDLTRFHPLVREKHRAATRKALGTDEKRPVALFVGSGFKRKGLNGAIAALATSGVDAEFWIVGHDRRPSAYTSVARRAGLREGRLRIIGPVADPVPYYGAADILVLPSIYDPFPSTVIEALACGLPVVTSTSCGAKEAVTLLDKNLVCDAFDRSGLATAVHRAFDLAAKPDTIEGARKIASGYNIETMIGRMTEVHNQLIA